MKKERSYTIIVGSQRSGTTLIGQIIGAHSHALVIDEEDGLYNWTDALLMNRPCTANLFNSVAHNAYRKYSTSDKTSTSHFSQASHIILKAPNLTYSWDEIAQAIPQAKIIYAYRSIFAVVASINELSSVPIVRNQINRIMNCAFCMEKFHDEIQLLKNPATSQHIKMALIALIKMSFAEKFRDAGLAVHAIQYEHLIENPENIVRCLLNRIGLRYEKRCIKFESQYQGLGPGLTDRTRSIDSKSAYAWQHKLTCDEQHDIGSTVENFLAKHPNINIPNFLGEFTRKRH